MSVENINVESILNSFRVGDAGELDFNRMEQMILAKAQGQVAEGQGSEYSLAELIYVFAQTNGDIPQFDPPEAYDFLWQDDQTFEMLNELEAQLPNALGARISALRNQRQEQLVRIRGDEGVGDDPDLGSDLLDRFNDLDKIFEQGDSPVSVLDLTDAHTLRDLMIPMISMNLPMALFLFNNFVSQPSKVQVQSSYLEKLHAINTAIADSQYNIEEGDPEDPEYQAMMRAEENRLNNLRASARMIESLIDNLEEHTSRALDHAAEMMRKRNQSLSSRIGRM